MERPSSSSSSAPVSLDYQSNSTSNLPGLSRFFPVHLFKREPKVYTPLPESTDRNPRAAYGKLNYKYVGNESEGNRFIFNNDLWDYILVA